MDRNWSLCSLQYGAGGSSKSFGFFDDSVRHEPELVGCNGASQLHADRLYSLSKRDFDRDDVGHEFFRIGTIGLDYVQLCCRGNRRCGRIRPERCHQREDSRG